MEVLLFIAIIIILVVILLQIWQLKNIIEINCEDLKDKYNTGIGQIKTFNMDYVQGLQKIKILNSQSIATCDIDKKNGSNLYVSCADEHESNNPIVVEESEINENNINKSELDENNINKSDLGENNINKSEPDENNMEKTTNIKEFTKVNNNLGTK